MNNNIEELLKELKITKNGHVVYIWEYVKIIAVCVLIIIGISAYVEIRSAFQEYKDLQFKEMQNKIKFEEIGHKQYQADTVVLTKKELEKMINERLSKELAKKIKKNKEDIVAGGHVVVETPTISGSDSNESDKTYMEDIKFHLDNKYLKVDGFYQKETNKWDTTWDIKQLPIEINFLETTTSKSKVKGVRNFYVESLLLPLEEGEPVRKMASKTFEVAMLKPSEDPTKKDSWLWGKTIWETKTVKVGIAGLAVIGAYKILK